VNTEKFYEAANFSTTHKIIGSRVVLAVTVHN